MALVVVSSYLLFNKDFMGHPFVQGNHNRSKKALTRCCTGQAGERGVKDKNFTLAVALCYGNITTLSFAENIN